MARRIIKSKQKDQGDREAVVVRAGDRLWSWYGEQAAGNGMSRNDLVATVLETFKEAAMSLEAIDRNDALDTGRAWHESVDDLNRLVTAMGLSGSRRVLMILEVLEASKREGWKPMKASVTLQPALWKKQQVAAMLNICVRGVERLVAMGKLVKVITVAGGVRITDASVQAYLQEIGCDQARVQA